MAPKLEDLELHHADCAFFNHECMTLYKYMTGEALYSFLVHGDLKITFPEDANDPFEFIEASETPAQRTSELGFISLSEENDNPSLWGNYAEEYKGACIKFSIPFITRSSEQPVKSMVNAPAIMSEVLSLERGRQAKVIGVRGAHYNVIWHAAGDVLYKCLYRDTPFSKDEVYLLPKDTPEDFLGDYTPIMKEYDKVATKSEAWKHEKEYRITLSKARATRIIYNGRKMYLSDRLTPYCSKIILAPYSPFTASDVEKIISNSKWKNKHIDVVRAEFQKGKYKLHIPD